MKVNAWYEKVSIPTYGIGPAEKNPMFLEKRVYQGSSGVVYPYPVIEKILDTKELKEWNAVFLENDFLKLMILPELGGRIQMAYDKMKNRHFIYYNSVIKPALVGLTGPWISGGIEFNWPQHHRPTTYDPVDHKIENNSDGSVTVWCSEIERMFHTKGMAGFTLYPDKAFLEIKVKLFNRTDFPQTFLWWANPAVKVNDHYQSVFPPDVHAVFDHGKRDVSEFPIAKGTYYKVNYAPGTDISRYKNIPVPTSYMAITSKYDFVGGYENDSKGGLLHLANHHVSPGKKQWTWGNGDFGKAWDRNLTDEDGPYIELMCGVYTDNQPDFSWLMPGEEKTFNQYFLPYSEIGIVKNATKEALLNLEVIENNASISIYTTIFSPSSSVKIYSNNNLIFEATVDFKPGDVFKKTIEIQKEENLENLKAWVLDKDDKPLVSWQNEASDNKEIPKPAEAIKRPEEIENNEQLYLAGLHLEQYRHATFDPRDYYHEALKRDPGDSRCNNALGLWHLKRGRFNEAESYFNNAINTLTKKNPNPIDGEPFYNLGLTLKYKGSGNLAYDAFYKSAWNSSCMENSYFQLARIETENLNFNAALQLIDRALIKNWHNHKSRHLKVAILRHQNDINQAKNLIKDSLALDKFNFGLYFEKYLISGSEKPLAEMKKLMRGNINNYLEFALDYAAAGMYTEADALISLAVNVKAKNLNPLALYCLAWFKFKQENLYSAKNILSDAAKLSPDFCFPNQIEAVLILTWAVNQNPDDFKAWYYLGNYWYSTKNYNEAISCWENSIAINNEFPTTHRNLALGYFNKKKDSKKALAEMELAFMLDTSDARVLMELDQLYKRLNYEPGTRLEFLQKYINTVLNRDDLYLELISLYNLTNQYEKSLEMIRQRKFHPWEGGEGKVSGQYVYCLTQLAKQAIEQDHCQLAIKYLEQAKIYPENLGEGKLLGKQENEINYWLGVAYEKLNDHKTAIAYWQEASSGINEPGSMMFYNDQNPDSIYYQGLALLKLKDENSALQKFHKLVEYGEQHLDDNIQIDYFAVSLPDLLIWDDDLDIRNKQFCFYLIALGKLGENKKDEAHMNFIKALNLNKCHFESTVYLNQLEQSQAPTNLS